MSGSTSAGGTCTTRTGHPVVVDWRAPVSRPFYRASPADPMGLELRRRFGFSGGELTAHEDEVLTGGPAAAGGQVRPGQPHPHPGDRAAAVRADARHRGHHRPGPGRHRPGRPGPHAVRAGCTRNREDRGRPAPDRLPAVRLRRPDGPGRGPGHRAEPRLPLLHPQRAARPRRGRRHPDHPGRPAGPGAGPGPRQRPGRAGQGRPPDGGGAAPGGVGGAARARRGGRRGPRLPALAGRPG